MKFKDYKIVQKFTAAELEAEIRKLGAEGWVLVGGPFPAPSGTDWYAQAMILPHGSL